MQSILISGKNIQVREAYIDKLLKEQAIDAFDVATLAHEGSIGIEEVRLLQKKMYLTPLRSKTKAVIINNAQNLTIEAQNALLKVLEEPPNNTIIVLTAENKNLLLPTILSRCKIIELKSSENQLESNDLSTLAQYGVGKRLKLAQDIAKDKDGALAWIENAILVIRKQLTNSILRESKANREVNNTTMKQLNNTIVSLQKTHTVLKITNVNLRLTLETLFLTM